MTKTKAAEALEWFKDTNEECVCDDCLKHKSEIQTITRALKLLDAVEAGTHKVVPVEPTEKQLDAVCGKDETQKNREFMRGCYACAVRNAPDWEG
jgi:hypothetical protein